MKVKKFKKFLALVLAFVMLVSFAACDEKSDSSGGKSKENSVETVVKEYTDDYIDYWELGGYKSLYKISADGAYYQIYTANCKMSDDDRKATLIACVMVYGDHIEDFIYGIYDNEKLLEKEKERLIKEAKEEKEQYIEELKELVEFYNEDN